MAKSLFSSKGTSKNSSPRNQQGPNKKGSLFGKKTQQGLDVFDLEDDSLEPTGSLSQRPNKGKGPAGKKFGNARPANRGNSLGKKSGKQNAIKKVGMPYTLFGKPLKGNLLAVDFNDQEIKILVARLRRQEVEVFQSVKATLQEGIVHNGEIMDARTLTDVIAQLVRTHAIQAEYVFFTVNNSDIIVRPVKVATALNKTEDIEGALSFELQQYLDIDPTAYNIEYQEVSEGPVADPTMRTLMVYAMPKRAIEQHLEIANGLKMTPYVLDLKSNALEKWLERVESINNRGRQLSQQNIGIIQLSPNSTDVYLYSKGQFVTSNHLERGLSKLQQQIKAPTTAQSLASIASGELNEPMVKVALDEWLSDTGGHILNTENFFTTQTGEYIHQFLVYGNEEFTNHLTPILKTKLGREFEAITAVDCRGIVWGNGANYSPDFIPASAMLIRRSN